MQIEKELSKKFIKYLKEHGYPEESIVCEWKVKNYRVDLAIIDVSTKKVMAIYEFKNHRMKDDNVAQRYLRNYLNEIGDYSIPAYVVYDAPNEYGFYVERIKTENEIDEFELYSKDEIHNYKTLQNSFNSGYVIEKKKEIKEVQDKFDSVCKIVGIIIVFLFVLDLFGIINMTINRIIFFSIGAILFAFSYLQSIKILGIEIERKKR